MQCEYRDNASGRTTAAESIADAWAGDGRDVDYREMDPDWRPLTEWQPYRPGAAALYAPPAPAASEHPSDPPQPKETTTMRIAVKSAGGIVECFLHADNAEEGAQDAARQIAGDYGLPVDLELWSDPSDGSTPRQLGELRFVALAGDGTVVQLD